MGVVVLGGYGSGKSTQCARASQRHGLVHVRVRAADKLAIGACALLYSLGV